MVQAITLMIVQALTIMIVQAPHLLIVQTLTLIRVQASTHMIVQALPLMLFQVLIMDIQSTGSKLNPVPVHQHFIMLFIFAKEVKFHLKNLQKPNIT